MPGRHPLYASSDEKPVMVSVRVPRDLYDETQQYLAQHRLTMTEFVRDALRLRLDTPADPRDTMVSDSSQTIVLHELQAMVDAAVQAALAKERTGTRTDLPQNSAEDFKGAETRDVLASIAGVSPDAVAKAEKVLGHGSRKKQRKDALPAATRQAILAERQRQPTLSLRAFAQHLFTTGVYQAEGRGKRRGEKVAIASSLLHRVLTKAAEAGLLD
jgi:hypothetical protein